MSRTALWIQQALAACTYIESRVSTYFGGYPLAACAYLAVPWVGISAYSLTLWHKIGSALTQRALFWVKNLRKRSKILVFFRVWSFKLHAPYILSTNDFLRLLWNFVGNPPFWRPTISWEHAVEKLWPPKKPWTLLLPQDRQCKI